MKITTKAQLIQHILNCKDAGDELMILWTGYSHSKHVDREVIDLDHIHIGSPIDSIAEYLYYKTRDGFDYCPLDERNITGPGFIHNNWWFTSEEEARDFINPTVIIKFNKNDIPEWVSLIMNSQKINAIKAIRAEFKCDLIIAKRFVDAFDISVSDING